MLNRKMREINLKKKVLDILLLKTMFSKLLMSFLLIILTVSSFYLYAHRIYLKIIETEITVNEDERFSKVVEKNEQVFKNIKNTMVQLYYEEEFFPFINRQNTNMYEKRALLMKIIERLYEKNYSDVSNYIKAMYVMPKQPDNIIVESLGTYDINLFYKKFFNNEYYTKEFWIDEMDKDLTFKIYQTGVFNNSSLAGSSQSVLTPFVFKRTHESNCLLISLVRIDEIIKSIDNSFVEYYYIYDNAGTLIYPVKSRPESYILDPEYTSKLDTGKKYVKTDKGYLFTRTANDSGLQYYRLVTDARLKQQLSKVNSISKLILILSILFSMLISLFIAMKFNNPVKQIAELITQPNQSNRLSQLKQQGYRDSRQSNIFDLNNIRDNIKVLVKQNVNYARDINTRNSDLEAFLYQARMNDIYIQANEMDEIKSKLSVSQRYLLIYFKIHFKQAFSDKLPHDQETSKITFLFKELIQLYVKKVFNSSISFQTGNKDIVSIVNVDKSEQNISKMMEDIINQLEQDSEYVYFTISLGKIYENVSDLKEAYNSVFEIAKHRLLVSENQILTKESIKENRNKFNFSLEQMEELTSLLRNGQRQESLRMVSDLLGYNLKKNVDSFYIKLLCTEIINCSVKLLTRMYYNVPEEINTAGAYYQLESCELIEDYEKVCHDFLNKTVSYILDNKKENDYIIDYITSYVEEHYTEDIYLDLLAEKLNLSTAYISSYFKTKLDINLTDYINNYRIKKSIQIIENSQLKVKDIAKQVGFANSNTFTRLFKKFSGFTPQEYRHDLFREM